jgi:hypothetical protein
MNPPTAATPLIDRLPEPRQIRERLSEIAAEANLLRSLLRVVEGSESGRRVLRRRERLRADGGAA